MIDVTATMLPSTVISDLSFDPQIASRAMIADSIYVMDEGRVTEQGTHEELLSAGSRYAEGWRVQARDNS